MLSIEEYLNEVKPYLSDMINDLKTQGKWKIQLPIAITFFSSEDSKGTPMNSKSNNIEIMTGNETDEIREELFESLLSKRLRIISERKQICF